MDVTPIVKVFMALITEGIAVSTVATAFFLMLGGFQYMSAGGSTRSVESAKSSLFNALIGFAIIILCVVIANLIGGAVGAPRVTLDASMTLHASQIASPLSLT